MAKRKWITNVWRYGTGKTRLGYTILKEIAIMGGIIGVIDVLHDFETFEQADEAVKTALKSNIIFIRRPWSKRAQMDRR
jgi:hypothetical protein